MQKQKPASWRWQAVLIVLPVGILAALGWRGLYDMQRNLHDQARTSAQAQCEKRAKELSQELFALVAKHPVPEVFDDPPKPVRPELAVTEEELTQYRHGPGRRQIDLTGRWPARTSAGLPTDVFCELSEWRASKPSDRPTQTELMIYLALLSEPSVITPLVLEIVDPENTQHWRETWEHVVKAQRFLHHAPAPTVEAAQFLFQEDRYVEPKYPHEQLSLGQWLFGNAAGMVDSGGAGMVPPEVLSAQCEQWFQERVRTRLQSGDGVTYNRPAPLAPVFNNHENRWSEPGETPWCELRIFVGPNARPAAPGSSTASGEVLASYGLIPSVTAVLVAPAALYGEHNRLMLGFIAVLVTSVISALAGLAMLRRNLLRERALSDMKTNFIASVTHELRAPVASLRLLAEGLEAGHVNSDEKRRDYFRLMVEECRRLGGLIANVLDVSRIERGSRNFYLEETDLPALVRDTVKLHGPRAESLGITLVCEAAELEPPAKADAVAMQQALSNLLDNAFKFAPRGSTVQVVLESLPEGPWRLSVEDAGPGVPVHERTRIFEAFYRVGSEMRRETPGVGIGLAIVKHIVEAHGGRVWVESEANKSTRFIVEGPRTV